MQTKYGKTLSEQEVMEYLDRLVGKVWKLLPIYEHKSRDEFLNNHEALMIELSGAESLVLYCGFYLELLNKVEGLSVAGDQKFVKRTVRECIDVIDKLKEKVRGWNFGEDCK